MITAAITAGMFTITAITITGADAAAATIDQECASCERGGALFLRRVDWRRAV
jgi:hypothetical protein